jgi:hypothetical protein
MAEEFKGNLQYVAVFTDEPPKSAKDQIYTADIFFENLDIVGSAYGWTAQQKVKIARIRTDGACKTFIQRNDTARDTDNYDAFKKVIKENFSDKTSMTERLEKLNNCSLQPSETIAA